tara:strand:- start:43 stop:270 length:228 start_codon:yes stop_codon:yes gene_type:complete
MFFNDVARCPNDFVLGTTSTVVHFRSNLRLDGVDNLLKALFLENSIEVFSAILEDDDYPDNQRMLRKRACANNLD